MELTKRFTPKLLTSMLVGRLLLMPLDSFRALALRYERLESLRWMLSSAVSYVVGTGQHLTLLEVYSKD